AALTQFWSLALAFLTPAFDHLIGILLIVISVSCTMYIGPDKEMDDMN
ncbi:nodulin MtN21/EamA-like transporter family protein, partial [Trifolium medium]|nr:nodulin MtN21/EamA-like transporter family protein [Trifolium medium]